MQDKKYKKLIKKLSTKLYIFTIKNKSGGLTFGKIEKHFKKLDHQTDEKYRELSSGAFYKYARGEASIRDQNLIKKIENDPTYTGSKYILTHPLWLIISNPSASKEELLEYMYKLNPDIQNKLFKLNTKTCEFERKKLNEAKFIQRLSMLNNLDALACLLMILREMELLEQWNAYVEVKWQVHNLFFRLTTFEPMKNISDELYLLIWTNFIGKHNPMMPNYFPKFLMELRPNHIEYYKSPDFVDYIDVYHKILKEISNIFIQLLDKKVSKDVELNILFWVHTYGVKEVYSVLILSSEKSSKLAIVKKIINAHESTNIDELLIPKRIDSLF